MKFSELFHAARLLRHPRYHREIIKHVRWTKDDERRLDFYRELIKPGDLVFDIGANMGNRSKIFIRLGARVVAFEPQSHCAGFLSAAFADSPDFTLVQEGVSDHEGEHAMHLGKAHTLATIDPEWLDKMRNGGRFAEHEWDQIETIRLTTLEDAINKYGLPAIAKIDVEGHELNVIKGLSSPVPLLSLEFASESLANIVSCIEHLGTLGSYEYRVSLGETMQFSEDRWRSPAEIRNDLDKYLERDPLVWGDIYARRAS
jgi:FkbM family methyltransferase